jgi:hypothetical protein
LRDFKPLLAEAFDPVFEAAARLAADVVAPELDGRDLEAADFDADPLALPVFAGAAAWRVALAFALDVAMAFFFAAGAGWADTATASARAAIDSARKRNFPLPFLNTMADSADWSPRPLPL